MYWLRSLYGVPFQRHRCESINHQSLLFYIGIFLGRAGVNPVGQ
jgi:hypothetical protein